MSTSQIATPFVTDGPTDYQLGRRSYGNGSGFVVLRIKDEQSLRWEGLWGQEGLWAFPVAGTSYRQDALQAADLSPGTPLELIPDPDNEYDPNAVGIWDHTRTHHIGFVPAKYLDSVGPVVRSGRPFGCIVMWETRADGERVAVRALLATGDVRVRIPGQGGDEATLRPPRPRVKLSGFAKLVLLLLGLIMAAAVC